MLLNPPTPKEAELEALASGVFAPVAPELILEITSTLDIQDFLRLCVTDLSIDGDARGFPLHILANCSTIETIELDLRCLVNAAGTSPSKWLLEQYGAAASPTTVHLHHGDDVGLGRFRKIFTMQPAKFSFRLLRTLQLEYCEIAPFTREDLARCRPGDFIPPVSWDGLSSTTKLAGAVLRNAGAALEKLVMTVKLLDARNSHISTEDMAGICNLHTLGVTLSIQPSYFLAAPELKDIWLEELIQSLPSTEKLEHLRLQYAVHLQADNDEAIFLRCLRKAMRGSLDALLFGNSKFLQLETFELKIDLFKKGQRSSAANRRHRLRDFFPSINSDLDSTIHIAMHPSN
ncbi:hypothetical protein NP233_g9057 [Leucocoprinus birnbaumii]|uniref:Uncharacterized protein n=1 Tax=Leucocoprinus birnbaumii TaxID=56174 RepID=A0AAD5YR88_9AGAR|nr:hypothetical protein NP233_g9057 [Leucocoprinus birnbaumii]